MTPKLRGRRTVSRSARKPRRRQRGTVIGIDPGTSAVGVAVWRKGEFVYAGEFKVLRGPVYERVLILTRSVRGIARRYRPRHVVVEVSGSFGRSQSGQANLMFGTGALAGAACVHPDARLYTVSPAAWYPRKKGRMLRKEEAMRTLKRKHSTVSEHVACAKEIVTYFLEREMWKGNGT